jgi:adenylate kinase family enzyme
MLTNLLSQEEVVKSAVRKSEEEVKQIIDQRTHEEALFEKTYSIYDTKRNPKVDLYLKELVRSLK